MFAQLKSLLAECHVSKDDKEFETIVDANIEYLLRRSNEAISRAALGENFEPNLKLSIRLLNLARYKHQQALNALDHKK